MLKQVQQLAGNHTASRAGIPTRPSEPRARVPSRNSLRLSQSLKGGVKH